MNVTAISSEIWDNFSLNELSWICSFPFLLAAYVQMFRKKSFFYLYILSLVPFFVCMIYSVLSILKAGEEKKLGQEIITQAALGDFIALMNYICFICFVNSILIFLYHLIHREYALRWGFICIGACILWIGLGIFMGSYYIKTQQALDIMLQ